MKGFENDEKTRCTYVSKLTGMSRLLAAGITHSEGVWGKHEN